MLKVFFKKVVTFFLSLEARLVLKKYKPKIIGVTGSVGKTSTKDAIYQVLKSAGVKVGKSKKSFNSEIGIPLSILGCDNPWGNVIGWLRNLTEGLALIIFRYPYPDWLVLEIGVDRPGDMDRMLRGLKLEMVVITRLPDLPVHVEYFKSKEAVAIEKLKIIKGVKVGGLVIANGDDQIIRDGLKESKQKIVYYGFSDGVDYQVFNNHLIYDEIGLPLGSNFKLNFKGNSLPVRAQVYSEEQILSLIPALIVGDLLGNEMLTAIEAVGKYRLPPGRLQVIKGVKDSLILDDTYNSSPTALSVALRVLGGMKVLGRRISVLGDMMELGPYTMEAHRQAGIEACAVSNIIVGVGMRSKFIINEALKKRFGKRKTAHFIEATEAGKFVEKLLKPGDLVLVKGSQSIRLEKVVEEIMAEPERASELLCRQESEWKLR